MNETLGSAVGKVEGNEDGGMVCKIVGFEDLVGDKVGLAVGFEMTIIGFDGDKEDSAEGSGKGDVLGIIVGERFGFSEGGGGCDVDNAEDIFL